MNGVWWQLRSADAADGRSHSAENKHGGTLVLQQQVSNGRLCLLSIRNRMALLPTQAFYLLINNSGLASMSLTMAQVYKDHQDEDGFLYMTYASQEMFGH